MMSVLGYWIFHGAWDFGVGWCGTVWDYFWDDIGMNFHYKVGAPGELSWCT